MNTYEIGASKISIIEFFFAVKDSQFELKMYDINPNTLEKTYLSVNKMLNIFRKEFDKKRRNNTVEFWDLVEMPDGQVKKIRLIIRKKDENTLLCERHEDVDFMKESELKPGVIEVSSS